MGSVQLDKKEWEAFLEKLSELEAKYLRVLRELDEAQARLNNLGTASKSSQPEKEEEATLKNERHLQEKPASKENSIIARIRAELGSLGGLGTLQRQVACSRCGHRITHATRFCEKCGADFGKLTCVCGRDLATTDRFCDRCGRSTTAKS